MAISRRADPSEPPQFMLLCAKLPHEFRVARSAWLCIGYGGRDVEPATFEKARRTGGSQPISVGDALQRQLP
jgi:hypothetical protein